MPYLEIGLDYKTTPLFMRERAAMDAPAIELISSSLISDPAIEELAILSTCNRTEFYVMAEDAEKATTRITAHLGTLYPHMLSYVNFRDEMGAAEHLFRVACGLESQALGEVQVLGQVRETLETSQRLGTVGPNLHSLFRAAIACARQGRAKTKLGRLNVSIGSEAVAIAGDQLGGLAGKRALVIGGGEVIRLALQSLVEHEAGEILIANRTESVAADLARRYNARSVALADVAALAPSVDLIMSATSAPSYVVTPETLESSALGERELPLHIFDLAIPRDVDPAVGDLPGVLLHDLDAVLPFRLEEHWSEDVKAMEAVIAAELVDFRSWYLTRRVVPVIASLRNHVEAVSRQEMKRVAPQLEDLTERERAAVESLTQRLIDKMFHHLVTRLRLAAQTDPGLVDAAEFFFLHGEGGLFEHAAHDELAGSEEGDGARTEPSVTFETL